MLLATPASAASLSSHSEFDVVFPGNQPQTTYSIENTATLSGGKITAKSLVNWQIVHDQIQDTAKRFTSFKITTRLETRLGKDLADVVNTSKTCDLTTLVNDNYSWPVVDAANTCTAPSWTYDGDVWWSSDSTIVYDIEGDGQGAITKQLLGSPLIHG
jgi:hypothetical protein